MLAMLVGSATVASADNVDWSDYIDKNPSQPVASRPVSASHADTTVAEAKPAPRATRKAAAKAKAKPKARAKAKRRH